MNDDIDVEQILRQCLDYPNALDLTLLGETWAKNATLKELAIGATAFFEATWAIEVPEDLTASLDFTLDELEGAMTSAPLQSSSPESDEFWWLILVSGNTLDREFAMPNQSKRVFEIAVAQLEMAAGSPALSDVQFHFVTSVASYLDSDSQPELSSAVRLRLEAMLASKPTAEVRNEIYDVLDDERPTLFIEEE